MHVQRRHLIFKPLLIYDEDFTKNWKRDFGKFCEDEWTDYILNLLYDACKVLSLNLNTNCCDCSTINVKKDMTLSSLQIFFDA